MNNRHLTDIDIQQFLFQESGSDPEISRHIQQCGECRIKADQYRQIFETAVKEKKPVFEFELTELVMKKLPANKPEISLSKSVIYSILFIALPVAGVLIYLFYTRLSFLLIGISPIFVYLIATVMISLFLFQSIDNYIQYKKQIKALEIY
jgi:hypothetical protein